MAQSKILPDPAEEARRAASYSTARLSPLYGVYPTSRTIGSLPPGYIGGGLDDVGNVPEPEPEPGPSVPQTPLGGANVDNGGNLDEEPPSMPEYEGPYKEEIGLGVRTLAGMIPPLNVVSGIASLADVDDRYSEEQEARTAMGLPQMESWIDFAKEGIEGTSDVGRKGVEEFNAQMDIESSLTSNPAFGGKSAEENSLGGDESKARGGQTPDGADGGGYGVGDPNAGVTTDTDDSGRGAQGPSLSDLGGGDSGGGSSPSDTGGTDSTGSDNGSAGGQAGSDAGMGGDASTYHDGGPVVGPDPGRSGEEFDAKVLEGEHVMDPFATAFWGDDTLALMQDIAQGRADPGAINQLKSMIAEKLRWGGVVNANVPAGPEYQDGQDAEVNVGIAPTMRPAAFGQIQPSPAAERPAPTDPGPSHDFSKFPPAPQPGAIPMTVGRPRTVLGQTRWRH